MSLHEIHCQEQMEAYKPGMTHTEVAAIVGCLPVVAWQKLNTLKLMKAIE